MNLDSNPATISICILIVVLSFVIQSFSKSYLEGDSQKLSFFVKLNLLTVSMLCLLLSNDLWFFFFSWLSANSLLVSLMVHKKEWKQAFNSGLITLGYFSIGFISLSSAIFMIQKNWGATSFTELAQVQQSPELLIIGSLLILTAMIQSAQIPFTKWLLSSLNSPTPVSAFMHAGLINGGGILIIKFLPVFNSSQTLMDSIYLIGSITAIIGTASMFVQTKIKNKLASSTSGQMGFMFMELGLGLVPAALIHLIMHGLFKSYLFLNAGSTVTNKTKNRHAKTSIVNFLVSIIYGLIITTLFIKILGIKFDLSEAKSLMSVFVFITASQFILSTLKSHSKKYLRVFAIATAALAVSIFAFTMKYYDHAIEQAIAINHIEINFIHYFITSIIILLWLVTNLGSGPKEGAEQNFNRRLYMLLVNFAQPLSKTITTQRKDYIY